MISLVFFSFLKEKKRPITLLLDKSPFVPIITCSKRALMWGLILPAQVTFYSNIRTSRGWTICSCGFLVPWPKCVFGRGTEKSYPSRWGTVSSVTSWGLIHSFQTGFWPGAELRDSKVARRRRKTRRFQGGFFFYRPCRDSTCENTRCPSPDFVSGRQISPSSSLNPRTATLVRHAACLSRRASFCLITCIKERVCPLRGGSRPRWRMSSIAIVARFVFLSADLSQCNLPHCASRPWNQWASPLPVIIGKLWCVCVITFGPPTLMWQ